MTSPPPSINGATAMNRILPFTLGVLALIGQLASPSLGQAQSVSSTFDASDEGWTIVGFDPYVYNPPQTGSPVTYAATFGNPGGSIEAGDVYWGTAVSAPAGFLGDRRAFFGGSINLDIYLRYVTIGATNSAVTLLGTTHTLFFVDVPETQTSVWVPRSYPLHAAGWFVDSINGPPATTSDMLGVLADLQGIWITTEKHVGADDTNVDNVVLAPPAHGSVAIFGSGINPAGSLSVLSGSAQLGTTLTLGIDNPLGTQAAGSLPFLAISLAPVATFPIGVQVPGLGMASSTSPGELLIDLSPSQLAVGVVFGPAWTGPGQPAPIPLALPATPSLAGLSVFAQGALLDTSATGWLALTDAALLVFGN